MLKGVAPPATISAYAIGQAIITTAWNAASVSPAGREIGWKETRALIRFRKKKDGKTTRTGPAETERVNPNERPRQPIPPPRRRKPESRRHVLSGRNPAEARVRL